MLTPVYAKTNNYVHWPVSEHMSESTRTQPAEEKDTTEGRLENPTGVLHLFQHESVEEVPNTSPRRYRVAKSDVVRELFELNSALNVAGE